MSDSTTTTRLLPQRPINRYSMLDNEPVPVWVVARSDRARLAKQFGLAQGVAEQVADLAEAAVRPVSALSTVRDLAGAARDDVRRLAIFAQDSRLAITEAKPVSLIPTEIAVFNQIIGCSQASGLGPADARS